MKTSSSEVLLLVMAEKFSRMPVFVRKLNLAPNILSFDVLFERRALMMHSKPLSLILLCPISRNYKAGWLATIFSAIAFAPS